MAKITSLLLLLLFVVLSHALIESESLFLAFVNQHQKSYYLNNNIDEYNLRYEIFKNNLKYINEYNAQNNGVTLGITPFADMTHEEFTATRLSPHSPLSSPLSSSLSSHSSAIPTSFDWRSKNVVGEVVNEGQCGSSSIFTITNSISSFYAIDTSSPYAQLSYDQVEQCTDEGCNGGEDVDIWKYVITYGIEFNFTGTCPKGTVKDGVCIKGAECMSNGNETQLAITLYENGPVIVAIDASDQSFELYTSGIYAPSSCDPTLLDHSLLLVGYTPDAWICQNTWGTSWGINGYILIARNKGNMCGIASEACLPLGVAKCA